MQPLPLSAFIEALRPLLSGPSDPASDPLITLVSNNSSKVTPGTLFLAIRGAKADGHKFIPDAARKGASALVVDLGHVVEGVELSHAIRTSKLPRA